MNCDCDFKMTEVKQKKQKKDNVGLFLYIQQYSDY